MTPSDCQLSNGWGEQVVRLYCAKLLNVCLTNWAKKCFVVKKKISCPWGHTLDIQFVLVAASVHK